MLILLFSAGAQAETWYLMAADIKVVSNPHVADRLYQASRLGPIQLTSQGKFPSRGECEPARNKLIQNWRQQSPNTRGSWNKYGITSPGEFIRCIPGTDPHLTKSPTNDYAKESPSLEIYLRNRRP